MPTLGGAGLSLDEANARRNALRDKYEAQSREGKAKERPQFELDQKVRLQHPLTKLWDTKAKVIGIREGGRSYVVVTEHGHRFVRNRKFLKPLIEKHSSSSQSSPLIRSDKKNEEEKKEEVCLPPRRSARLAEKAKQSKEERRNFASNSFVQKSHSFKDILLKDLKESARKAVKP